MALISCYECGKQISDQAKACPNCGAPVKAPEKKKFCKYCGTQITESVTFCPACGKPQTANAVPQEQSQQPVQPASYRPQQFAAMGMQQPFFMPCAAHPQSPAVASCGSCGKSICNECADKSEYRIDNVPLCRECNLQLMNANIAESESTRNWSVVKLIFLLVCVLIILLYINYYVLFYIVFHLLKLIYLNQILLLHISFYQEEFLHLLFFFFFLLLL